MISPPALLEAQRTQRKIIFSRAGDDAREKPSVASRQDKLSLKSNVLFLNEDYSPKSLSFFVRPPSPGG
jgi:hypothetical protein